MKISEVFMLQFSELRNACNDRPQALITFFWDDPKLRKLLRSVNRTAESIEKIGDFRKVHPQTPPQFIADWRKYHQEWRKEVDYLRYVDAVEMIRGIDSGLGPSQVESFDEWVRREPMERRDSPDPEWEEEFDPSRHDGAAAFRDMMHLAGHEFEVNKSQDEDSTNNRMANTWGIGLDAMRYLDETVGISVEKTFSRWNKVPSIFVPTHVSDRQGMTEKGSLFELLNDAIRAYVAGAPAAAIAICRAALEMVLREHYLKLEKNDKSGLREVISIADARFEQIEKSRLYPLKNRADKILHDYTGLPRLVPEDDEIIVQFIVEVKRCIEMAPEKSP